VASTFFWIGNHVGLDFLNTEAVDDRGDRLELLNRWDDLLTWAETAGLVGSDVVDACRSTSDRHARRSLQWARKLRASARGVLDPDGHDHAGSADTLAATVAEVPVRLTYRPDATPGGLPLTTTDPVDTLHLALAVAVLDAARLDRSRIRRCEGDRCVLVYYDTSKNRSRRWCTMTVCGNRAKAAAHYERTKQRRTS
jgi:predicted RNA-binding Zn ribbon-like protein